MIYIDTVPNHLINTTKATFIAWEIPGVLEASWQKWEEDQTYIFHHKSQYHEIKKKYLGTNLTMNTKNLDTENYKALQKEM